MEVYCVKEKRFTPNVAGSEKITTTRNGRRLLKSKMRQLRHYQDKFCLELKGGNILDPIFKWTRRGLPKKQRDEFAAAEKRLFGGGGLPHF